MIISPNGLTGKMKGWYRDQVYAVWNFRMAWKKEQDATDPKEKNKLALQMKKYGKKSEQHMIHGKALGLDDNKMKEFNLFLIREIKQGKDHRAIIRMLFKE
ncbi:MAG: hypothetical protein Q8P63_02785 [Candidatus Nealsonbacteria bacterium]|nr:hypothetical protein [Candidatus Nealsonbacteria bacterium]